MCQRDHTSDNEQVLDLESCVLSARPHAQRSSLPGETHPRASGIGTQHAGLVAETLESLKFS